MDPMYTLDSSLFINGWRKVYKPTVFPGVWSAIDHALSEGWAVSCYEVLEELRAKDDEITAWVNQRAAFFPQPNEGCLMQLREVMAHFPSYIHQDGAKNRADPFVVATALMTRTAVVTFETPQPNWNSNKPPKIPLVCEQLKVPWLAPQDFLEAIGQKFK